MDEPPRRLTNDPNHEDFHPSYQRVGVIIDGIERKNISWYDADRGYYRTTDMLKKAVPKTALKIEPYFRYIESRQQRRARERWETSHGK